MVASDVRPLRDIPLRVTVAGVQVTGEIVSLTPSDMSVVILSPVSELGTCLHVPHFAMYPINWLATYADGTTTAITARGQERREPVGDPCTTTHRDGQRGGGCTRSVQAAGPDWRNGMVEDMPVAVTTGVMTLSEFASLTPLVAAVGKAVAGRLT
jgi:hypothetical protein